MMMAVALLEQKFGKFWITFCFWSFSASHGVQLFLIFHDHFTTFYGEEGINSTSIV